MANTQNLEIGPAKLTWGTGGSAVDLGHTLEGVEVEYEGDFQEILADYYGTSLVNQALVGEALRVTAQLAEPTLANVGRAAFSSTPESGDDTDPGRVNIGRLAGFMLGDNAQQLRVHPLNRADADTGKDWVIYRAVVTESFTMGYTVDDQRVLEVTFEALVDESKPETRLLGHFGPDEVS